MSCFRGRSLDPDVTDAQAAERLDSWLKRCCRSHTICNAPSTWWPETLIDVGTLENEEPPRLIHCARDWASENKRFVLFSARNVKDRFQLVKSNVEEMWAGIKFDRLARIHQQAIWICRRLGYRFLFIHALCVVQDDDEMQRRTNTWLGRCFENADLVLASSNSIKNNLFSRQRDGETVSLKARIDGIEKKNMSQHETFDLQLRSPLQSASTAIIEDLALRGWRLQEAILSRRLAFFTKNHLIWSCCTESRNEGSSAVRPPWFDTITSLKDRLQHASTQQSSQSATGIAFDYWRSIVENASRGSLKMEQHRLVILEGMADSLEPFVDDHFPADYLKGIWSPDVWSGLLWVSAEPYRDRLRKFHPDHVPPSWSYAWNRAPISYRLAAGLRVQPDIPGRLELQLGSPDGVLTVFALATEIADDTSGIEHYEYFWDAVDDPKHVEESGSSKTYADCLESGLSHTTLAIVAPWTFRPSIADKKKSEDTRCFSKPEDARWIGLVLKRRPDGLEGFVRAGVFLGPFCTDELSDWERKELKLY